MLANSGRSCTLLAIAALGFTSVWLCLNIVSTFHVDITGHNALITENDRLESVVLRLAMARHVVNTSMTSSVINCTLKRQPQQQQLYSVRQQFLVADRNTTNMTLTSGPSLLGYSDIILPVMKLCQGANHKPAKLVVIGVIFSASQHANRRQTIRDTWGSAQRPQHADIAFGIIFILGLSPDGDTLRTRAIMAESAKYNDILLKDFTDSHQNLSLKSCSALEWVSRHCPAAQYVAKIDDDVFVNTYVLLDYLSVLRRQFAIATARSTAAAAAAATLISSSSVIAASPTSSTPSSILCFVHAADKVPGGLLKTGGDVGRRKSSDGTDGNYPPFCAGPAYVVERQAVTALYAGCRCAKYFPYEDVLITGILAREAAVRLSPLSQYYLLGQQRGRWAEEMLRNNDRGGKGGRRIMAGGNRPRKHAYMFCHMAGVRHTDDSVWRQLWTNITHMRTA